MNLLLHTKRDFNEIFSGKEVFERDFFRGEVKFCIILYKRGASSFVQIWLKINQGLRLQFSLDCPLRIGIFPYQFVYPKHQQQQQQLRFHTSYPPLSSHS